MDGLLVIDKLALDELGEAINQPQDILGSNLLQIKSHHFIERRRLWKTNLWSCHQLLKFLTDLTIIHPVIDGIHHFRANPTCVSLGINQLLLLLVIVYFVHLPDGFERC